MSKKPIIGVTPLWDAERKSVWMLPEYLDAIRCAGGIPVVLPLLAEPQDIERLAGEFDGFLFTGGHDVSPELYGAVNLGLSVCSPERDAMETFLLKAVLKEDKPVLGICRGLQLLNAVLGGTLWQDLPTERPSEINHRQGKPYDKTVHKVKLMSALRAPLEKAELRVNSRHHQAIQHMSAELIPAAFSPDNLVEAAVMPSKKFVLAVQWHPEYLYEKDGDNFIIFEAFIEACLKE